MHELKLANLEGYAQGQQLARDISAGCFRLALILCEWNPSRFHCACPCRATVPEVPVSSGSELRFLETHWHMFNAGEEVGTQSFDLADDFDLLYPGHECLQRQPQFEARQMCARTEVLTSAERQVLIGCSRNIKGIGILEHRLITIGRREPQSQPLASSDPPAT